MKFEYSKKTGMMDIAKKSNLEQLADKLQSSTGLIAHVYPQVIDLRSSKGQVAKIKLINGRVKIEKTVHYQTLNESQKRIIESY